MEISKVQPITPKCCKKVQEKRTVFLLYDYDILYNNTDGQRDLKPKWKSFCNNQKMKHSTTDVKYCPHCATPVPEIKKRNTTEKICSVTDGGYYCNTCNERLHACTCFRPEYAWEPDYTELELLNKLKDKLKKEKYKVFIKEQDGCHFLRIEGRNICGGACTTNEKFNRYLNGKLAVDRKDCFDKWSKCPINLPLPKNQKEIDFIIKKLEWLQTKRGFEISNNYEFDEWITKYHGED